MSDDTELDPRILFDEKERLSFLPYFQRAPGDTEHGVLLSDRIEYYCGEEYKLIQPFEKEFLRPAGYDLRVGFKYAKGGERSTLCFGEKLTIGPYQVAVIQILETLNLPDFLIGRWNIRVGLAYKGLLWVGGAQVDPGFRGQLCCPIYNLSTEAVDLYCGDKLAMIDFVTTTRSKDGQSKPFGWWTGKKLVFQEYSKDLRSGVENNLAKITDELKVTSGKLNKTLDQNLKSTEKSIANTQSRIDSRIDTFLTLVFTVVAVLFAGLGIVATKGSDDPSFFSSPVWVAAVALYFALKPYAIVWAQTKEVDTFASTSSAAPTNPLRWTGALKPKLIEVLVASIIVFGSVTYHAWHAHVGAKELATQKEKVDYLASTMEQQKQVFESELERARVQSDAKIQSLQEQIEFLKKK